MSGSLVRLPDRPPSPPLLRLGGQNFCKGTLAF